MSSRSLFVMSALVAACGAPEAPAPVSPVSAAPVADPAGAQRAAEVALGSLAKRKYNIAGCASADARVATEAEVAAITVVNERCTVLVVRRPDRTWLVGIRSPAQLGGVSAAVTVSPGGEGVTHIDYQPPAGAAP